MTPIFNSPTDPATVQQCVLSSLAAIAELKQQYTFVTFDLAMAKVALSIIWSSPQRFQTVIIHLGGFHIMCAYMGALEKMVASSGFEEVLTESRVCASVLINQVMIGKHYNRAIRVHQLMLDALNQMTLDSFIASNEYNACDLILLTVLAEHSPLEALGAARKGKRCPSL
jgi:hypothetical protein